MPGMLTTLLGNLSRLTFNPLHVLCHPPPMKGCLNIGLLEPPTHHLVGIIKLLYLKKTDPTPFFY
jgi:hypothetical protein